jgi:outer membrane protein assembly factor BamA
LDFIGVDAVSDLELVKASKPLFNDDYSRLGIAGFVRLNLVPIYRKLGHLRVRFSEPQGAISNNASCKDGVAVRISVTEGVAYKWDRSEWQGVSALTTAELDKALGMKAGELANGLKIDKGVEAVHAVYARKGYIAGNAKVEPLFDDSNARVSVQITVNEGPQYHMGNFTIEGLPEGETNYLRGRWLMMRGDVYDAGYSLEYMKKLTQERRAENWGTKRSFTSVKPDKTRLVVDVTITFSEPSQPEQ